MKDKPRPRGDLVLMVKYMQRKCPVFAGSARGLTQPPPAPNPPKKTIRRGTMRNNNNKKKPTSRSFLKNMSASQSSATLKWLSWETVGLYHFKKADIPPASRGSRDWHTYSPSFLLHLSNLRKPRVRKHKVFSKLVNRPLKRSQRSQQPSDKVPSHYHSIDSRDFAYLTRNFTLLFWHGALCILCT